MGRALLAARPVRRRGRAPGLALTAAVTLALLSTPAAAHEPRSSAGVRYASAPGLQPAAAPGCSNSGAFCAADGNFSFTFSTGGNAQCAWTLKVNWGDGIVSSYSLHEGQSVTASHHYSTANLNDTVFSAQAQASGTPGVPGGTCSGSGKTFSIEVPGPSPECQQQLTGLNYLASRNADLAVTRKNWDSATLWGSLAFGAGAGIITGRSGLPKGLAVGTIVGLITNQLGHSLDPYFAKHLSDNNKAILNTEVGGACPDQTKKDWNNSHPSATVNGSARSALTAASTGVSIQALRRALTRLRLASVSKKYEAWIVAETAAQQAVGALARPAASGDPASFLQAKHAAIAALGAAVKAQRRLTAALHSTALGRIRITHGQFLTAKRRALSNAKLHRKLRKQLAGLVRVPAPPTERIGDLLAPPRKLLVANQRLIAELKRP